MIVSFFFVYNCICVAPISEHQFIYEKLATCVPKLWLGTALSVECTDLFMSYTPTSGTQVLLYDMWWITTAFVNRYPRIKTYNHEEQSLN